MHDILVSYTELLLFLFYLVLDCEVVEEYFV
jgi:hypothetical protein